MGVTTSTAASPEPFPFSGIVLAGGASRRLGTDKALVDIGGRTLVQGVARALRTAGAREVVAIGGDEPALRKEGLEWIADRWPGEGPLGGIVTGLTHARHPVAVVCACDLPEIGAEVVRQLLVSASATTAEVVVPVVAGRRQPLLAAYRTSVVRTLEAAFSSGVRSVLSALDGVAVEEVTLPEELAGATADVDTPEDLQRARGESARRNAIT